VFEKGIELEQFNSRGVVNKAMFEARKKEFLLKMARYCWKIGDSLATDTGHVRTHSILLGI
jgi:hypothetical protein